MPNDIDYTEFVTVREAADHMKVSTRTIRNLIDRGAFPGAARIDPSSEKSTWRIPRKELKAFLANIKG